MRILIVEDDLVSSKVIELNLRKHRYETIMARSGKEALTYLGSNDPVDLVISDIMMPDVDGLSLLYQIKSHEQLKDIPVIMCSALSEMHIVKKAIAMGCCDYITKPVNPGLMLKKVMEVLGTDIPVLQKKTVVMGRLHLDIRSYDDVARTFSGLVNKKIACLEEVLGADPVPDITEELMELSESVNLLGAEKVKKLLTVIRKQDETVEVEERRKCYTRLLEALRELREALPRVTPHSAPSTEKTNGKNPHESHMDGDSDQTTIPMTQQAVMN